MSNITIMGQISTSLRRGPGPLGSHCMPPRQKNVAGYVPFKRNTF